MSKADDGETSAAVVPQDRHVAQLLESIQQYWGYDSFRPLQREAMLRAMERRDSLTVLPTGGGKSLCYQAPAVCRDGMAVVVSPLIALMKDQVDALTECGIPAAFVNSSLTTQQRLEVAGRVRSGELKMLFAAPERLVQPRTIDFLREVEVSFIAIDEAHCISNWGHDFRPEYRQLSCLRDAFPEASIHAFTATATERVRQDIVDQLRLHEADVLVGSFDRPNLTYRVERRYDVQAQVCAVIDRHRNESGIVYCISRAAVEDMAASLKTLGYRALPYHAGLSPEDRRRHQESFIDEKVDIIVATVAFGMGIDKSNVRYVVHAEMPRSVEAYQQESGRAGRDGLEAECCLIYSGRDISTWEFLINQSENAENRDASLAALAGMEAYCSSVTCRHRQLVRHFGQELDADNCGACDVCLNEIDTVPDALVVAQKILSSVYRQEQRFGAEYTTLVLRGSRNKKIRHNGHDRLSTHGLLKDEPEPVVRGWIDQLLSQGFLQRSGEHSVLVISATGRSVLRGEVTPVLTRPQSQQLVSTVDNKWEGVDRGLFEALRAVRMDIAEARGVPPYVILGDVTLRELAKFRPTSVDSLLKIYGIGQQKQVEFGAAIVSEIADYCQKHELSADLPISDARTRTVAPPNPKLPADSGQYFDLFDQGLTRDEVALQLDRAASTVAGYLVRYIHIRQSEDASQWIPADVVRRVEQVVDELGADRLKPIYEALEETVTYDDIRIVLASRKVRHAREDSD
ncbi:MAG: DNA helicase RecQ [Fuerstiella sp.]